MRVILSFMRVIFWFIRVIFGSEGLYSGSKGGYMFSIQHVDYVLFKGKGRGKKRENKHICLFHTTWVKLLNPISSL